MGKRILAILAIVIGVGGIIALFVSFKSARSQIESSYPVVAESDGGRSKELHATDPPSRVVERILAETSPSQTIYLPAAVFMRFQNDVVAVAPSAEGGSQIYLDEASRGYRRWFPYVGAFWALNSARSAGGSSFRGGGPGGGGK